MNALISIIIPAYNAEKYLHRCVSSVAAQSYRNLEIIVVNDGSVDKTGTIADELAEQDNRIIVIHQKNQGVSAARNAGLDRAKGDYIGFVDADDEISPDMYATLLTNMDKYDADISHCGFELVTTTQIKLFNGTEQVLNQTAMEAIASLLKGAPFEPSSCTKLFKKESVANVRYHSQIKFNEDLLFNVEAFRNAETIVFHDAPLYRYFHNPASASRSTSSSEILKSVLQATVLIKSKLLEPSIKDAVNQFYVGKLLTILQSFHFQNKKDFSFEKEVKHLLQKSTNQGLNIRSLFMKYALLYWPGVFGVARWMYDRTLGRNKKWDINE